MYPGPWDNLQIDIVGGGKHRHSFLRQNQAAGAPKFHHFDRFFFRRRCGKIQEISPGRNWLADVSRKAGNRQR
jgi:hypothetical protein